MEESYHLLMHAYELPGSTWLTTLTLNAGFERSLAYANRNILKVYQGPSPNTEAHLPHLPTNTEEQVGGQSSKGSLL